MTSRKGNVISLNEVRATNVARTQTLKIGDAGQYVVALQKSLASWGFSPGESTGRFDEKTAEALRALQRKIGIEATGILTPDVVSAIRADLAKADSKLKAGATALAVREPDAGGDMPATPTAQIIGSDSEPATSAKKWLFWGALGVLTLYMLGRGESNTESHSTYSDAEDASEETAEENDGDDDDANDGESEQAVEGFEELKAVRRKRKQRQTKKRQYRHPRSGKFVKKDSALPPTEYF